jgi:uncharacterized membrane protein
MDDANDQAPVDSGPSETPALLRRWVRQIEASPALDGVTDRMAPLAGKVSDGGAGALLRGQWLGHALHPLLTDLPLGCWLSASLLDVVGGRRAREAAQRLVGLGLLATPATALAGLADWNTIDDGHVRRVGTAHAIGNGVVAAAYLLSWRSRRKGHHLRGAVLGLTGGTLAIATGYLGGHLSFARGAGVGDRGIGPVSTDDRV